MQKRKPEWDLPESVSKKQRVSAKNIEKKEIQVLVRDGEEMISIKDYRTRKLAQISFPAVSQERSRYNRLILLRESYSSQCKSKLSWDNEPKSSFNRFLTDQLLDKSPNSEPLLPTLDDIEGDLSKWIEQTRLFQEIEEDYPAKIKPPIQFVKHWHAMKDHLRKYVNACEHVRHNFDKTTEPELTQKLQECIKAGETLLDEHKSSGSFENLKRDYSHIRKKCFPILQAIMSPTTRELVLEIMNLSTKYAKEIQESNPDPSEEETITCTETPNGLTISNQDVNLEVSKETKSKLLQFYEKVNGTADDDTFNKALFILILRYNSFIGSDYGAGGLQAALPRKVFYYLNRDFGVTMECFASPLNSYFSSYCSAFFDCDSLFGSVGSFFDFYPSSGSFEANPPFCEKLMDRMVEHMEFLLSASDEALSFTVIIPDWSDADAYKKLRNSKFFRSRDVVYGKEHYYKSGLQHQAQRNGYNKLYYKAVHDTSIFFLQNDAGYAQWRPSSAKLKSLRNAFCSTNDSY